MLNATRCDRNRSRWTVEPLTVLDDWPSHGRYLVQLLRLVGRRTSTRRILW
jgi:hypothetical protein